MTDGENEGDDCDEVNQEESDCEHTKVDGMKKGADSIGEVMCCCVISEFNFFMQIL